MRGQQTDQIGDQQVDDQQTLPAEGQRQDTTQTTAAATAPTRVKDDGEDSAYVGAESTEEGLLSLFEQGELEDFRSRWLAIQGGFVDQPRKSVEKADQLVGTVTARLAEIFAGERERLEGEWTSGDDVSTEDLRIALRRYRSFFDRLLSV